jgi:hypothetical protein
MTKTCSRFRPASVPGFSLPVLFVAIVALMIALAVMVAG